MVRCIECTGHVAPKTTTGAIIRSLPYAKRVLFEIGLIVKFLNSFSNQNHLHLYRQCINFEPNIDVLNMIQRLVRKTKIPKLELHVDCMNFYENVKFYIFCHLRVLLFSTMIYIYLSHDMSVRRPRGEQSCPHGLGHGNA